MWLLRPILNGSWSCWTTSFRLWISAGRRCEKQIRKNPETSPLSVPSPTTKLSSVALCPFRPVGAAVLLQLSRQVDLEIPLRLGFTFGTQRAQPLERFVHFLALTFMGLRVDRLHALDNRH